MDKEKKELVEYAEPPEGLPQLIEQIVADTVREDQYQIGRPRNDSEASAICDRLARSSAIPRAYVEKPGDIYAVMIAGQRFGWDVMQSMMAFACIHGSVRLWGDAAHAVFIIANRPRLEVLYERPPDVALEKEEGYCRVKFKDSPECDLGEDGDCSQLGQGCCVIRRFSRKDAEKAGLWGRKSRSGEPMPWSAYPGRMLQMRARSWAERDADPGCFKGYGITEEVLGLNRRLAAGAPIPRRKSEKKDGETKELSQKEVSDKLAGKKPAARKPEGKKPAGKKPAPKKKVPSPWIGKLNKIDRKNVGGKKKGEEEWLYLFYGEDGAEFSTTNKDHVDQAKSLGKGSEVEIYWKDKDLGRDIDAIDPHIVDEEKEPEEDNLFDGGKGIQ